MDNFYNKYKYVKNLSVKIVSTEIAFKNSIATQKYVTHVSNFLKFGVSMVQFHFDIYGNCILVQNGSREPWWNVVLVSSLESTF